MSTRKRSRSSSPVTSPQHDHDDDGSNNNDNDAVDDDDRYYYSDYSGGDSSSDYSHSSRASSAYNEGNQHDGDGESSGKTAANELLASAASTLLQNGGAGAVRAGVRLDVLKNPQHGITQNLQQKSGPASAAGTTAKRLIGAPTAILMMENVDASVRHAHLVSLCKHFSVALEDSTRLEQKDEQQAADRSSADNVVAEASTVVLGDNNNNKGPPQQSSKKIRHPLIAAFCSSATPTSSDVTAAKNASRGGGGNTASTINNGSAANPASAGSGGGGGKPLMVLPEDVAILAFQSAEDAEAVQSAMNGGSINGRAVRVSFFC